MVSPLAFPSSEAPGRRLLWLAAFALISGVFTMVEARAQSASAWLELKPLPGRDTVQIIGHALAMEAVSGMDFSLSLQRQNKGNTSTSQQSGRVDLAASEPKVLSTTSINMAPGDELTIELKLMDKGREVSSATITSKSGGAGRTP
jgi:hypothetical protein